MSCFFVLNSADCRVSSNGTNNLSINADLSDKVGDKVISYTDATNTIDFNNKTITNFSGGGGGGDAFLANTQTFTGVNTFSANTNTTGVTNTGDVNTTGEFQKNGTQIASADLSDGPFLSTTTTGIFDCSNVALEVNTIKLEGNSQQIQLRTDPNIYIGADNSGIMCHLAGNGRMFQIGAGGPGGKTAFEFRQDASIPDAGIFIDDLTSSATGYNRVLTDSTTDASTIVAKVEASPTLTLAGNLLATTNCTIGTTSANSLSIHSTTQTLNNTSLGIGGGVSTTNIGTDFNDFCNIRANTVLNNNVIMNDVGGITTIQGVLNAQDNVVLGSGLAKTVTIGDSVVGGSTTVMNGDCFIGQGSGACDTKIGDAITDTLEIKHIEII